MSLPLRKRTVHFYEVQLRSYSRDKEIKNPACAPLPALLDSFKKMMRSAALPLKIGQSTHEQLVLTDWRFDTSTGSYALLLSKANAALSDVALRDLHTTQLRRAGKTKTEGIEISAHVLLRPNANGKTAAVLITMGAGVAANDVRRLLRLLAKQAAQVPAHQALFAFDDPSGAKDAQGQPLKYKVYYGFDIFGYQGQTLEHALGQGEFEGMDLIAQEASPFDAGGNLKITERSLGIRATIPKAITAATILNTVRQFQKKPDGAIYDRLRIRYKTPTGQSTGTTLDINALDAAFNLKEVIEFESDVDSQQSKLDVVILDKMFPLLNLVT